MERLVREYIDGLIWVFDFYFNNFDEDENRKFGHVWFYPYNHAPLLTQIYYYLKENKDFSIIKRQQKIKEYLIPRKDYFNCLEHLMYVSPAPYVLDTIPKEYHNFAKTSEFYPNMNKIAEEIWKQPTNDEIDCRGVMFLNKCHLTNIHVSRDVDKDKRFINELRKIELGEESAKRRGVYKIDNSGNINYFNFKNKKQQSRIKINNNYAEQYGIYKKKYLDEGNSKYKKLYKFNKYKLMNLI